MNKFSSTKNYLYVLLLAIMAMLMLAGCSTTGESGGGESGGGESFSECTAKCESSDLDCREDCT